MNKHLRRIFTGLTIVLFTVVSTALTVGTIYMACKHPWFLVPPLFLILVYMIGWTEEIGECRE